MKPSPITSRNAAAPCSDRVPGDLTAKQYAALETVARLSPGYTFQVLRYDSVTHVAVRSDRNDRDEVGLVGKHFAQYYDQSPVTEQVVKRVAHRVYRQSGLRFQ